MNNKFIGDEKNITYLKKVAKKSDTIPFVVRKSQVTDFHRFSAFVSFMLSLYTKLSTNTVDNVLDNNSGMIK